MVSLKKIKIILLLSITLSGTALLGNNKVTFHDNFILTAKDFKSEDVRITVVYELNSSSNGTQTVIYSSPEEIVETPSPEPEQPTDEPKQSKCSSGTYFISIVLLMSLCGVLINKRK